MKTFLIAITVLISAQAFADKDLKFDGIRSNVKLPVYTRQSMSVTYSLDDKSQAYVYFQPYTLSSQILAKRKILYTAVMQSKSQGLYSIVDTDFIVSGDVIADVRGHCLNYIGDGKGRESDENPNEFLYLFFELNRAQQKVNFHKVILRQTDKDLRDKFDALHAICSNYEFTLATKVKLASGVERQVQDIIPELKKPLLQFDVNQFVTDSKKSE